MIKTKDRPQDDVIQWSFPHDKENPTIFHLKRLRGLDRVFVQSRVLNERGEYSQQDWVADNLLSGIVKVENFESEDGKTVTLTDPNDMLQLLDILTVEELHLLILAINRNDRIIDMGMLEKNSGSPSGSPSSAAKKAKNIDATNVN